MCVIYDKGMFKRSERIVRVERGAYPMTAVLQQVSDALATTVATVSPSIVRVEARRRLPASGVVWSRDGIIVTTHHVIEQDDNIHIGLHSGQTVAATLVGRDAPTDLACRAPPPSRAAGLG
jgi:S1-C subfamily serine protease